MIQLKRTSSDDPDFIALVAHLDADLAIRDGSDNAFYAQFNKIDKIRHAVIAYELDKPVSCGAIKEFSADTIEVKRMYTLPEARSKGIASLILGELEKWAAELSFRNCILETGKRQPEALALYKKNGYRIIENYGQYAGIENSVCFDKAINEHSKL